MWIYEKKLIYPLGNIRPNPRMAKLIAMLLGGANGELTASLTYLNQRYCMPCPQVAATFRILAPRNSATLRC